MKDVDAHTPQFSIQGLSKHYGAADCRIDVLSDINLDLQKGEMIAITGASGTGKSTLLYLLGALDTPDSGTLYFNDENIFAREEAQLADFRNKIIGFVFQFHHLLPEFSALENTMMPGLIAGMGPKKLQQQAIDLLGKVGLSHRINHKVAEMSGGEQQRVALARATIMKPALLLADEPTGNLDPKTGDQIFALIREMAQSFGMTTVMVTHNYDLARQMDRSLTLQDGKLSKSNFD